MIYILLGGRCGNQLFSYAFVRKLLDLYPDEQITLDLSAINMKSKTMLNGNFWEDSLSLFNTIQYETTVDNRNNIEAYGTALQNVFYLIWKLIYFVCRKKFCNQTVKLQEMFFKLSSKAGVYYLSNGYSPYFLTNNKNKFVCGSFEDIRWFDDIREKLLLEMTPKADIMKYNNELYTKIKETNSVCVSLRKWEIDVHEVNKLNNRQICDSKYYKAAIHYMNRSLDNPVFVVFSDDIDWGVNIIKDVAEDALVLRESGHDNVAEKLRLMYSCKHFILANSTFCWWAQYLCQNANKIVISPDRWFNNSNYKHPLILSDWILIDTEGVG